MWNLFLTSNAAKWRTLRTVVQGILGVLIANVDTLTTVFALDGTWKALIVALTMAVLSPIMKALGTDGDLTQTDVEVEVE